MPEIKLQLAPGEVSQVVLATLGGPITVTVPNTHPLAEKLVQLLKEAGPLKVQALLKQEI